MNRPKCLSLKQVARQLGIPPEQIIRFIAFGWIVPIESSHLSLDTEDIARTRLIWELQAEFGVNDEAVPIILHLVDQLNRLHFQAKELDHDP